MASNPSSIPDIRATYGCILLGTLIGAVFYGITLIQIGTYYGKYPKDPISFKTLVAAFLIFDTAGFVLETHGTWFYFGEGWGHVEALTVEIRSIEIESGIAWIVTLLAHLFFTVRIWRLSGNNNWLLACFLFLSLSGFAIGIALTGVVLRDNSWISLSTPQVDDLTITHKVITTVTDVSIAVVMCILLHNARAGAEGRTSALVNYLMVFAANRGILTALIQTTYLVTFVAWKDKLIWVVPHCLVSKFYVNSVLATLNVRDVLRRKEQKHFYSFSLRSFRAAKGPSNETRTGTSGTKISFAHSTTDEFDIETPDSKIGRKLDNVRGPVDHFDFGDPPQSVSEV